MKISSAYLVLTLAAVGVPLGSAASLADNCRTHGGRFFPAQNDTVSYSSTMDAKGWDHYFKSGAVTFTNASILARPRSGTLSSIGALAFHYQPATGFKGQDSYAIKVCGTSRAGTGCSTVNYTATVQ